MNFLSEALQQYIEAHSEAESEVLKKLNRETYAKVLMPRMLSGHLQGRLLAMISNMVKPRRILEIGTFTGYSAICLAEGLTEDGLLFTVDVNEELEGMARKYFTDAGVAEKVVLRIGKALEIIPTLDEHFDLVFIDADKINYNNYYNIIFDKVVKNGFIIVDNVLWSGKVVGNETEKPDKDTKAIIDFNDMVQRDQRVQNILLPIRDGLMVVRKK